SGKGGSAGAAAAAGLGGPGAAALQFYQKLAGSKHKKKVGIAALAGGGITGLIIAAFFALLPLKVMSIVTNLKNDAFAASNNAVGKIGESLIRHYIVKAVVPGMVKNNCTTTLVTKSCADVSQANNIVSAMYRSWFDANVEGKMAANEGVEIIRKPSPGGGHQILMRIKGINNDLDLGTYNGNVQQFKGRAFAVMDSAQAKQQLKLAYRNTTFSQGMHYRFVVKPLAERKYGIRSCLVACDIRKQANATIDQKRMAGKLYLTERILIPRTDMMGLALQCALSGFNCAEPGPADANGERQTQFERDIQLRLAEYRATHGESSLAELQAESDKIREKGFVEYMVKQIAGETASKFTTKAIPVIGWIDMAATLVNGAAKAGPGLRHMNYVMNSKSYAALASMYLTNADEQKAGLVDATVQGAIAANFDQMAGNDQGGGAMEATPLYERQFGPAAGQTASVFDLFSPRAYAAEEQKVTAYTCDDGNPVPAGEYMCPEVQLGTAGTAGKILDNISAIFQDPALSLVAQVAGAWVKVLNGLIPDWFGDVAGFLAKVPLVEDITKNLMSAVTSIFKKILVNPFTELMSGGRNLEITAAGMWVMGMDDAHYNIGGQALTPAQIGAIQQEEYENRMAEFKNKPLYARMFDTEDSMSLTSRLALATPTSDAGMTHRIGSILSDPLGSVSRSFSAIFSTPQADALWQGENPAGVKEYGYPANDPVFTADPEEYVEQRNCSDPELKKKWGDKAVDIDPATGVPIHNETEGCLLMQVGVSNGGGIFDTTHIIPNQAKAFASGGAATSTTPPTGDTTIQTGDVRALAQQIFTHPNISFQTAQGSSAFNRIVATGRASSCGSPAINPKLLGVILTLAQSYKLVLGVLVDGHGCPGQHGKGNAVDINGVNPLNGNPVTGSRIGDRNPNDYSPFDPEEQAILKEFWTRAGQVLSANGGGALGQHECFTNPKPGRSPGVLYFSGDSCDHIHLDVR
ncbi:MAG TPA: hypothetical protein VK978_02095, partial [Candidatus Saccharimonadales bacterium]|nr:hypothetical protein [Candidatus Saccharimonadales bacterium]